MSLSPSFYGNDTVDHPPTGNMLPIAQLREISLLVAFARLVNTGRDPVYVGEYEYDYSRAKRYEAIDHSIRWRGWRCHIRRKRLFRRKKEEKAIKSKSRKKAIT